VGIGFLAGILSMLPVAAMLMLFGTRPLVWVGSARLLHLLLSGLLSGLAVSLVEETLFRGLLQGAVWREAGTGRARRGLAILGVAVFYAALHFLARVSIPAASVNPYSGLTLLASVGDDFLHFGRIADSFAALTAVGILLSLTRLYSGSIALAIGLHAGWVMVMRITVGTTARPMDAPYAFLASTSDGFTGWLVFAWTAAIIAALLAGWRPAWLGMTPGARSPRT
jgi:membrane protease YdiL (CAAX protease family)